MSSGLAGLALTAFKPQCPREGHSLPQRVAVIASYGRMARGEPKRMELKMGRSHPSARPPTT